MKRMTWIVALLVLAVCGMGLIFGFQAYESKKETAHLEALAERKSVAQGLTLELEKYRRENGTFRKLGDAQIASIKADLKKTVADATRKLDELDSTEEERALSRKLNQQLGDFFVLSAKLEPMLFLRDVYLKEPAREAHAAMLSTIDKIRASAEERKASLGDNFAAKRGRWTQALVAVGAAAVGFLALLLINVFVVYVRPLRRLLARARDIREGKLVRDDASRLRGDYAEIERSLDELALSVESQERERQQFVTAVATDLRVPLVPLQTSASLLASVGERLAPEQRAEASEVVRRSVTRLSRTLDDLNDVLLIDRGDIRLEEKIVDLREVASRAAQVMGGVGGSHDVRMQLPSLPIWASVDGLRLERVMIHLISKVMQYSPQGGGIEVSVSPGKTGGMEIRVHEGMRERAGGMRATGPEVELLRHWVSENGFGMTLAQRIAEAHGGGITAAGLSGSSVVFTLRLPEERIAHATARRPGMKTVLSDEMKSLRQQGRPTLQ